MLKVPGKGQIIMTTPPIHCTPCRLTLNDQLYRVYADGSVSEALTVAQIKERNFRTLGDVLEYEKSLPRYAPASSTARVVRKEASRLRRNRHACERAQARRDLGMTRTTSGQWE